MPRKTKSPRSRSLRKPRASVRSISSAVDKLHAKLVKLLMRAVTTVREIKKIAKMLNLELPKIVIRKAKR